MVGYPVRGPYQWAGTEYPVQSLQPDPESDLARGPCHA